MDPVIAAELANTEMLLRSRDSRRNRTTNDIAGDAEDRAYYAERDTKDLNAALLEAKMEIAGAIAALRWLLTRSVALERAMAEMHEQMGEKNGITPSERQRIAMDAAEARAQQMLNNPNNQPVLQRDIRALVNKHRPIPRIA